MLHGLSLRVSWTCLLLFSSGACFPATKGDYRYPYTATWGSSDGPAPRPPLASLQHEPSAVQQPGAAHHQAGSSTGNQSPSSLGAPSGATPSYGPNRFVVSFDSSSDKPSRVPEVPPQGAGYVSPPVGAGKKTPSFSVQPQPGASTSGDSSPFYDPAHYAAAPATSNFAAPVAHAAAPATSDVGYEAAHYAAAPATTGFSEGAVHYAGAPSSFGFGDGPAPYGNPSSSGSLSLPEQPAGGFDASFYDPSSWMPSRSFPDLSVWDSEVEAPQSASETSPLAPSSYIIQSRNGYLRAREDLSHMRYVPEYPEPPVMAYPAVKAPQKSPAVTGPKGGKKV